jgi:hypothetical protein
MDDDTRRRFHIEAGAKAWPELLHDAADTG